MPSKIGRLMRGASEIHSFRESGASYDASAQAILAFSTPPSDARKALINAYVVGMKADGVWSVLDVLYVRAAADGQGSRPDFLWG